MEQKLELELPLPLQNHQIASQPEEGKKLQGRKWVPDEQEVGQAAVEGPESYLGAIAIGPWEWVPGELDESQPAVAGPELYVLGPQRFVLTRFGSVLASIPGLPGELCYTHMNFTLLGWGQQGGRECLDSCGLPGCLE